MVKMKLKIVWFKTFWVFWFSCKHHFLGFQTNWIMTPQDVYFHTSIAFFPGVTTSLNFGSGHCDMLIQFVLKTMLFLAINVTQGTPWDQKKSWLLIKKKFWFGLIWVYFPKIDLWGLFFTQILVPNPVVQSEKRYNEKYRFFQKLRKVAINQLFF